MSGIRDEEDALDWNEYDYEDWDDFVSRPSWSYRPEANLNNNKGEEQEQVNEVQELDELVSDAEEEEEVDELDDDSNDEEDQGEVNTEDISGSEEDSSGSEEQELTKRQRRRIALRAVQEVASSSTVPCKCGSTTHRTAAHRDCPLRVQKLRELPDDKYPMPFTIKTALNTVCQYDDVKNTIRDVCAYATKLVYFGSIFVNYFVLFMMENNIDIPQLDQTFVYTCFSLMAGEGSKATEVMEEAYEQFKNTPAWTNDFQASLRNIEYMKVISYLARTYVTSLRLHMAENIEKRTKRYFFTLLSDVTSEHYLNTTIKARRSISTHVWSLKLNTASRWPSSVERTEEAQAVVASLVEHFLICPVPLDDLVYSQPHLFMRWMVIIQEYMTGVVRIMEPKAETFASKAYVRRRLEEFPFVQTLGAKAVRSLQSRVYECINIRRQFHKTKKLESMTDRQVEVVRQFIKTVQDRIDDGTFAPLKYTDPRGARMFTLLPLFTMQDKFIHMDTDILWKIAGAHRDRRNSAASTMEKKKALFRKVFQLDKIQRDTENKEFCYVATSDGTSINFHYRRILNKKTEEEKANPFSPANIEEIIQLNNTTVWGVDPGVNSIYTAQDNQGGRIRSMSSKEYYQRIGNTTYNRFVSRHRQDNADDYHTISTLPTLKTNDMTDLRQAIDLRIQHYDMTKRYYGYLNQWSLELYRRKQRCMKEMVKQLVGGSKKYSINTKSFNRTIKADIHNKTNPKDTALDVNPRLGNKVVIGFGGAVFKAGIGTRSGPLASFYDALYKHAIHDANVYIFKVNEYFTSQVCKDCQVRTLTNKQSATASKIHAVLQCSQCHHILNRDENASANIRDIMIYSALHNNARPTPFQIPENDD